MGLGDIGVGVPPLGQDLILPFPTDFQRQELLKTAHGRNDTIHGKFLPMSSGILHNFEKGTIC